MDEDFGAFTVLSTSPPVGRTLASLLHHAHRPAGPSRSASTLSPVAEGNEDAPDGRASTGSKSPGCPGVVDSAEPVQIISTSLAPSRTFLELTRGGFFNADSAEEETAEKHEKEVEEKEEREAFRVTKLKGQSREDAALIRMPLGNGLTNSKIINSNKTNDDNNNSRNKNKNGCVEPKRLGPSTKHPTATEDGQGAKLTETRSPRLARPKMANSGTLGSRGSTGGPAAESKPLLPALGQQSVEQAVHRDRVNALLRPANSKPALGKLNRKSGPPVADGKPAPPMLCPPSPPGSSKSGPRSARTRKLGSAALSRPKIGTSASAETASSTGALVPGKTQAHGSSPPAKGVDGVTNVSPKQQLQLQEDNMTRPCRRKSLPEIQAPRPPMASLDQPATTSSPARTSPQPRRPPPRRKISEPCFPTQGSLASLTGHPAEHRVGPCSLPSSPTGGGDVTRRVTAAVAPQPPRRKISEPCLPTYGSPVTGNHHQQPPMRGIFADPRYNPVLLGSQQSGSCPDLQLRRTVPEGRRHAGQQNLSALSRRETSEPRPSPLSFTEEYEKLKSCRYLRNSSEEGGDDL